MKNKILFGVCVLFGLLFINAGLNKFFKYMPMPDDLPESMLKLMTAFTETGWLFPLVGVVEVIGGILFIPNKYRALGAIIIFPIMVGILLVHLINEPSGMLMALILMAINVWVIIENREKYVHMIR